MKNRIIVLLVLVLLIPALGIYFFYVRTQAEPETATLQINQYTAFRVDENGNANAEWVYEIPPSELADHMRFGIVGGAMGDVPIHGMGVENAKLMFSADVQSSYAKYGLGVENVSCEITGLNEGETFKVIMEWRTPHLAYRRENMWEILFQPVDSESYAEETINEMKSFQSTLSVIAKDSQLNLTSRSSITMPTGTEIVNENELLSFEMQIVDYGGGTTESTITYIQEIDGKPAVVSESQALIKQQLITITREKFLEVYQFYPINYTGIPPAYCFDGSASWVAADMKFGRERGEYRVSFNGSEFDITPHQLLYYSAKRVVILAENSAELLLSDARPISISPPDDESGDWDAHFKTLTRDEYVAIARDIRDQMTSARKVPGGIKSSIGMLRSRDALFTFLRVISFYHEHGKLPDDILFAPAPTGNLIWNETEIPANYAYFLFETQYVITDTPRVKQMVLEIRRLGYSDAELAENFCEWVHANIKYPVLPTLGWFTSEEILDTREGKCLDKANLYLALMRTADIPAKRVEGFLIFEQVSYPFVQVAGTTPDGRYIVGHAWTEVYLPQEGWVFVDPTGNLFRMSTYEDKIYSSVGETWQEVLASYETTYEELV